MGIKFFGRSLVIGAVVLGLLLPLFVSISIASAAPRTVGVLDFSGWCDREDYVSGGYQVYSEEVLVMNNAYGWRCSVAYWMVNPGGSGASTRQELKDIDTNALCRWQYPQYAVVYARTFSPQDAYSWRCIAE